MSLTKPTFATNNIASLSETPNITEGLSALQLQQLFDKVGVDIKSYLTSTLTTELDTQLTNLNNGWVSLDNVLTFSSLNTRTSIVTTSIDLTSMLSIGMKIKLTQTTTKYFIITGISETTLTLYGGTNYTLINAAITNISYSSQKSPYGFPINPDKWDIIVKDTSGLAQSNPTAGTYYNIGTFKIDLEPGSWDLGYDLIAEGAIASGTQAQCQVTLSTSNNSVSDADFNSLARIIGASGALTITEKQNKSKNITVNVKTPYYLLAVTGVAGQSSIGFKSATGTTILKAKCVYL